MQCWWQVLAFKHSFSELRGIAGCSTVGTGLSGHPPRLRVGFASFCSTREFFRLRLHRQVVGATSCICGAEQLLLRTQCPHYTYVLQVCCCPVHWILLWDLGYSPGECLPIYFHPKGTQLICSETTPRCEPKHTKWQQLEDFLESTLLAWTNTRT